MSSFKCRCRCIKNCDRDRECDHEEEKEWIRQAIKEAYWRGFKDGCRKQPARQRS
jgi:Leu/Phe-tRNA-protein transferase